MKHVPIFYGSNKVDNMNNAGKPWLPEENGKLINEYTVQMLDIIEIARLHGRTPVSILCKLKSNNVIQNEMDARGYNLYITQKEANPNAFVMPRAPRETSASATATTHSPAISNTMLLKEITDMKKEICELHNEIRELTAMMRASFEFADEDEDADADTDA